MRFRPRLSFVEPRPDVTADISGAVIDRTHAEIRSVAAVVSPTATAAPQEVGHSAQTLRVI